MSVTLVEQAVQSLEIVEEEEIAASIEDVFETILEQLGPGNEAPGTGPMPMRLEAWPGGRWFRDLGNETGHFWGHVQAIKPATLLEVCGPLFMSHPGISNIQFRLKEQDGLTYLRFTHRAMALLFGDAKLTNDWSRKRLEQPDVQDSHRGDKLISFLRRSVHVKSFFDENVSQHFKDRLAHLRSDSKRQWGKMNAAQMVAHLCKGMEQAIGDVLPPRIFLGRIIGSFVKPHALGDDDPNGSQLADSSELCDEG